MAEKKQLVSLMRAYTYAGKVYGPGPANIDASIAEALAEREAEFQQQLADGFEPPAPVTPASTDGVRVDPRKRTIRAGEDIVTSPTVTRNTFIPPPELFAGQPLSFYDGKSDAEIIGIEAVDAAMLKKIRAAQKAIGK